MLRCTILSALQSTFYVARRADAWLKLSVETISRRWC